MKSRKSYVFYPSYFVDQNFIVTQFALKLGFSVISREFRVVDRVLLIFTKCRCILLLNDCFKIFKKLKSTKNNSKQFFFWNFCHYFGILLKIIFEKTVLKTSIWILEVAGILIAIRVFLTLNGTKCTRPFWQILFFLFMFFFLNMYSKIVLQMYCFKLFVFNF